MKEIDKIREDLTGAKQIIEQLEAEIARKEQFIMDTYPTIKDFKITEGWYGAGTSTYRVTFDVYAEDLFKLIRFFTHKTLREKKYYMIRSIIKEDLLKEIEQNSKEVQK